MRKNKIVVLLLLVAIMVLSATLVACVPVEDPHVCGHVCSTCGKCTDAACTNSVCADKCQGHTPAAHTKCPNCEGCLDASCTECDYTCECVITNEQALAKAVTLVKGDYKEKTVITASTDFAAITSINGYEENRTDRKTFSVSIVWTLENVQGVADAVSLTKKEDGSAYTLAVVYDSEHNTKETTFTLKAVITCGDKSETWTLDSSIPQFVYTTYEQWLANCEASKGDGTGPMMNIKAYVIGVVNYESSSKGSLYLQDADGHGYYAYNPTDASKDCSNTADLRAKWPVGTEVIVSGTGVVYGGQYEFEKNCTVVKTGNTAESAGVTLDYVDASADFAAAKSNEDNDSLCKYQNRRVTLKDATITNVSIEYNSDGTTFKRVYYYFTLPGSDVEFNVYYTIYFIDEATMQDLHSKLVVGKIVDLTGVVSVFSSDFQVYPDSATSVSNVRDAELTDAQKVAMAKENLTLVNTASEGDVITLPATGDLDTTITWAFADGKTYDGIAKIEDGKLTIVAASKEAVELEIVATITKGDASDTRTFTVKIPALRTSFIKAALTAGATLEDTKTTEDSYMIIGTISKITSAYSEQYKNVSFNIVDAEGNELLIFRYNLDDAATLKEGDFVAFAAPIKKWGTDIEAVSTFVKLEVTTLKAAYDAGTEGKTDSVNVYGYVKSIDYAYSSDYDNISITITDGTNDLYCYRVKGGKDIAVGDYLYITAKTGSYNNKGQLAAGGTYVKSAIYVAPSTGEDEEKITTIADAINASAGAEVELTGTVSDISEAWSSYNNMSFYISDGTKKILVYRSTTQVVVGDIVSVSGTITIYSEKAQIASGSTVTITTKHVCSDWTTATCEDASVCTTCGAEKSAALGHVDENSDNICDRDGCGWIMNAVKKSLTITGSTGTMGTKEISWTNDVVTVKNEQANSTSAIRNSDSDHFRAYKSSKLTISVSSGTIARIVVNCLNNTYANALQKSLTTTGATAVVNGTNVVITITGDINSVEFTMADQSRITAVEVAYIVAE